MIDDDPAKLPPYLETCLISALVESLKVLDTPQPNGNGEIVKQMKRLYVALQEKRKEKKK